METGIGEMKLKRAWRPTPHLDSRNKRQVSYPFTCFTRRRRLRNNSTYTSRELVKTVLVEYSDELTAADYAQGWREEVFTSALRGYERLLARVRRKDIHLKYYIF